MTKHLAWRIKETAGTRKPTANSVRNFSRSKFLPASCSIYIHPLHYFIRSRQQKTQGWHKDSNLISGFQPVPKNIAVCGHCRHHPSDGWTMLNNSLDRSISKIRPSSSWNTLLQYPVQLGRLEAKNTALIPRTSLYLVICLPLKQRHSWCFCYMLFFSSNCGTRLRQSFTFDDPHLRE
jgi:hypothetical protein